MKKAAFAAVVVLVVVALSGSNLLSQAPVQVGTAVEGAMLNATENVQTSRRGDRETELLRQEFVHLTEMKSERMSSGELKQAIQEMQWLRAEAELVYHTNQLKNMAQKYAEVAHPAVEQVLLKANLAVELLETNDRQVLMEVREALLQK